MPAETPLVTGNVLGLHHRYAPPDARPPGI